MLITIRNLKRVVREACEERRLLRESVQRYCSFYKASDGKWYMELADREYGEQHDATTYGPFSSEDEADRYLSANFSNPGSMDIDDGGTRTPPVRSPNGTPVINPHKRWSIGFSSRGGRGGYY
jgi:hypothetical protein